MRQLSVLSIKWFNHNVVKKFWTYWPSNYYILYDYIIIIILSIWFWSSQDIKSKITKCQAYHSNAKRYKLVYLLNNLHIYLTVLMQWLYINIVFGIETPRQIKELSLNTSPGRYWQLLYCENIRQPLYITLINGSKISPWNFYSPKLASALKIL